jgi:cytochrome c biogenesis protein CcmG, thiol:disulfide interchange protein DsbE
MPASRNWLLILPPLIFLGFAALAFLGLRRENPDELPSALVGNPAPALVGVTALRDDPAPTAADLTAPGVKLVNFWASWCAPCRAEHPQLTALADEGIPVIGINYKDQPDKALGFLAELGDPFARIGADPSGRTGVDWGIYGVPETFVIDGAGKVLLRFPGPLTVDAVEKRVQPAIDAAE